MTVNIRAKAATLNARLTCCDVYVALCATASDICFGMRTVAIWFNCRSSSASVSHSSSSAPMEAGFSQGSSSVNLMTGGEKSKLVGFDDTSECLDEDGE